MKHKITKWIFISLLVLMTGCYQSVREPAVVVSISIISDRFGKPTGWYEVRTSTYDLITKTPFSIGDTLVVVKWNKGL